MREDDSNWFSKWEDELPPPEDLMPLSQSLITPDLALAFNIPTHAPPQHDSPAEFDSPALSGPGGGGSDESTRTLKRPRLVWTPQLHKRFVDAVAQLGIKNAVPKTIMQHMRVEGLTRENVASHLQKYRLYLKRMQSISTGGGGGPAASGVDSATDRLFASMPVPAHFLHPGRAGSDHYLPFVTPPAMQQHHHHQMAAAAHHHHHPQLQQQFRHFGNGSPPNGQFEHAFMRQSSHQIHNSSNGPIGIPMYGEDLEPAKGKKVLTLFPTGDE